LLERNDLRVFHTAVRVGTIADDVAVGVEHDSADMRIGRGETDAGTRELEGSRHELFICGWIAQSLSGSSNLAEDLCGRGPFGKSAVTPA
jgi:hypothetical protein